MEQGGVYHMPRLGIGEAMRIYGLTARALRFYEEKGLIEARRDRLNARHYDGIARRRLAWIARLRRADLPLNAIEAVLAAEEDGGRGRDVALRMLERRRAELHEHVASVEALLAEIGGEGERMRTGGSQAAGAELKSGRHALADAFG